MANKKKPNFGVRLLLFVLELCVAVALIFFAAKKLPKDFTITSIGSGISQSLLITTPEPDPTPQPTPEPTLVPVETATPAPTPLANNDVADGETNEVGSITEEPTDPGTEGDLLGDLPDDGSDFSLDDLEPAVTPAPELLTTTGATTSITISAAGDCTLGGDTTNGGYARFEKVFNAYGEDYFFENVKSIFEADDLTIVNLEGALTNESSRKSKEFSFKGAPSFGKILTSGSVEVVSIDNNHSQDYYSQGLADTKKTLEYLDIGYAGLGTTYTTYVKGVNVGFLSYRVWDMKVETMRAEIQELKRDCDLVIVSIHWGEEKEGTANNTQIKLGHAAIDAGADLVLGHHPHVVGSIEVYNGKYIVYSLGNFCFGGNANPADKDTFIFQQTFNFVNGAISDTSIEIIPCTVSSVSNTNDYKPTPVSYEEGGKAIMKKIIKCSQQFESVPDWDSILAKMESAAEG